MNALKLFDFFRKSAEQKAALQLYRSIVAQARSPGFYLDHGVPDTVDGRFDMITLHAFLVLYRLKKEHSQTTRLTQSLFDLLFADMDQNLREMGVGDLGVGRKIKSMTAAFQGRIVAYESALDNTENLKKALERNLFRHVKPNHIHLDTMAQYVQNHVGALDAQSTEKLVQGDVTFSVLPNSSRVILET